MDEKLSKLRDMGRTVTCPSCGHVWKPEYLKDKRCPDCQKELIKEIEMEYSR